MPKLNWKFFLFFGIIGVIFLLYPELDILTSSLFYDGVFHKEYLPYMIVFDGVRVITFLSTVALLILLTLTFWGKTFKNFTRKNLIFLILALILGPGLMVNAVLKDTWGRARPLQIQEFGGKAMHTPPFIISKANKRNGSFVCGHAAVGFAFVALGFVFRRREKEIFYASLLTGSFIGLVRMAQGGHFLSDVIFSFFFTYITIRLLYYFMYKNSDPDFHL